MPKILPTLLIYIIAVVSFLFLFPSTINAQVVVNEVLPDPEGDDADQEWIEIYNPNNSSLEGYVLEDRNGHKITLSAVNDKWAVIYPHNQGGFAVTNSGLTTIKLYESLTATQEIDSFSYDGSDTNRSWGRIPDGGAKYSLTLDPTPGSSNQVLNPSPSPTSTPTSTPTPTPTPTPPKTPTPTPTKTPTPKPTKSDSGGGGTISENSDNEVDVLGLRNQLASEEPSSSPDAETSKKKSSVLPFILIIFGAGLMGFAGYTLFKKMKTEGYNNQDGENL